MIRRRVSYLQASVPLEYLKPRFKYGKRRIATRWRRNCWASLGLYLTKVFFPWEGELACKGAFAVEKKGTPLPGQIRVTRLIMDQVPSSSFQRGLHGDSGSVANVVSWSRIILADGTAIWWSSADQRGAFCIAKLPAVWRCMMVFCDPAPASELRLPGSGWR